MDIISLSSWLVFGAALFIFAQNLRYLFILNKRTDRRLRRQSLHFGFCLISLYLAALYLLAALNPANIYLIRSGLASKAGILIIFAMLYLVTRQDQFDTRHTGDAPQ